MHTHQVGEEEVTDGKDVIFSFVVEDGLCVEYGVWIARNLFLTF